MELFKHIYNHPAITEAELERIINAHETICFRKGDFFLKAGQVANEYYILEKGVARSYVYNYRGDDITTDFFTGNEVIINVLSLFRRTGSEEYIQALTNCVCRKIAFDDFQQLFHTMSYFAEWGRGWMSDYLFYHKQRSIQMITLSASDRYLSLMKQKPEIMQSVPLKQIASYLGITDTSLSRIRKEIAKNRP